MPRQVRIQYPGAMYHLMSRGNRRQDIYLDDVDRQDFLKTLAEACQKTRWQIHAYCLMTNHYHLVVETPNPNLVAGMAWLQSLHHPAQPPAQAHRPRPERTLQSPTGRGQRQRLPPERV
jgi:REP element-mobilizing transposase RayT